MTPAPAEPLFHCPRSADLAIQVWSDGVVVYDDANGRLHALTPVAGHVLQTLVGRSAFAAPELALELLQGTPDPQDLDRMRELLGNFETLGFVERCPAACRTWGVESENRPQREQFSPASPPHSPAMGPEAGEKWAAALDLQPTIPKSDRLPG